MRALWKSTGAIRSEAPVKESNISNRKFGLLKTLKTLGLLHALSQVGERENVTSLMSVSPDALNPFLSVSFPASGPALDIIQIPHAGRLVPRLTGTKRAPESIHSETGGFEGFETN